MTYEELWVANELSYLSKDAILCEIKSITADRCLCRMIQSDGLINYTINNVFSSIQQGSLCFKDVAPLAKYCTTEKSGTVVYQETIKGLIQEIKKIKGISDKSIISKPNVVRKADKVVNDEDTLKKLELLLSVMSKETIRQQSESLYKQYKEYFRKNVRGSNNSDKYKVMYDGLKQGLNISVFAKPEYDAEQMQVILEGLECGIDIGKYAFDFYTAEQMRMIYYGLMEHIPVDLYALPCYDATAMNTIRHGLEIGTSIDCFRNATNNYDAKLPDVTACLDNLLYTGYGLYETVMKVAMEIVRTDKALKGYDIMSAEVQQRLFYRKWFMAIALRTYNKEKGIEIVKDIEHFDNLKLINMGRALLHGISMYQIANNVTVKMNHKAMEQLIYALERNIDTEKLLQNTCSAKQMYEVIKDIQYNS